MFNKSLFRLLRLENIEDPLERYRIIIVYVLNFILILLPAIVVVFGLMSSTATQAIVSVGITFGLVFFFLTWHGRYQLVGTLYPILVAALVAGLIILNDGIFDESVLLLPTIIALSGLLTGRRGVMLYTAFSIVLIVLVGFGQQDGFLAATSSFSQVPISISRIVQLALLVGVAGTAIYLIIDNLNNSLQMQSRIHSDLRRRNEELEGLRAELAQRVEERTMRAESAARAAEAAQREAEAASLALAKQAQLARFEIQLGEALIGELGVLELTGRAIRQVCLSINAKIGAFYVWDGEFLVLIGSYALKDILDDRRYSLGEGLVGQAAMEKRSIYLEMPKDSDLAIDFGIGQVLPHYELIEPVLHQNALYGVMVVGLLDEPDMFNRQFLSRAAIVIGAAIQSAQSRERINALLQRTQTMAKNLQLQDEELRASNEELLAQTRISRRP